MCDHEEQNALRVVTSAIRNCEKVQPKFEKGTPQHTLLQNRLRADVYKRQVYMNG